MPEQFTNRKDDTYYLLQGQTKTGKPKYYCSKKPTGDFVEAMPAGFEWYEHPDTAIVSVRKSRPTRILPAEREMLADGIRQQAGLKTFLIDLKPDSLIVYLPDRDPEEVERTMDILMGVGARHAASMREWMMKNTRYTAMMRFRLTDADERLFEVDRWCFRGRIDNWIELSRPAPLPVLIREFVPHLGQESFFDLI